MEMTERAATTLGAKAEVDKVVAEGRSAPPTMKRWRRDLMHRRHAPCWRDAWRGRKYGIRRLPVFPDDVIQ